MKESSSGETDMPLKEALHRLVDQLPETEMPVAVRFLEFLCADTDQEPLSADDRAAIQRARDDLRQGRSVSLDELKQELQV